MYPISSNGTYLSPGQRIGATFVWTRLAACEHLGTIGIPGHSGTWATYHFSAPCRGELGVDGVLVGAVRL